MIYQFYSKLYVILWRLICRLLFSETLAYCVYTVYSEFLLK